MTTRVLVVDDEPQIRRALSVNLRARQYEVALAATGAEALRQAATERPDVVLLDLGLPDIDGLDVIDGLRGWTEVPIIVLTVRDRETDKVAALDRGADDYLTKPFGMNELLARIRAAVRRGTPTLLERSEVVAGDLRVDIADRRVWLGGSEVHLTPTEWGLLYELVRVGGRLVTQRHLLAAVWGPQYGTESHYLRVHMANLRRKIESDPSRPRYVLTEPGVGYRFGVDEDS